MGSNRVLSRAVLAATAVLLAAQLSPRPAVAQGMKRSSPSVTILEDPSTAAFRKALNALSPELAGATRWQESGQGEAGALTATSVTIDVPWNGSRVTADHLTVGQHEISLQGVHLDNGKGTFQADKISGPVAAFRILLRFAFGETGTKPPAGPAAQEPLRITNFRLSAKQRTRGTARFSSAWSGGSLVVDGLRCAAGGASPDACGFLDIAGFRATALNARSSFAGEAAMQIGSVSFDLTGEGAGKWSSFRQLASHLVRPLDSTGTSVGVDLAIKDLHLVAARRTDTSGSGTPARIDVDSAGLSIERAESGSLRLKAGITSRFSPIVAKGTPVWPALADEAKKQGRAEAGLLPLDANIDAAYGDGRLSLSGLSANVAGLFDLDGSANVTGLQKLTERSASAQSGGNGGIAALAGIAVHSFSLVMEDKGLSDLIRAAFDAWPSQLLREAAGQPKAGDHGTPAAGNLMSLMTGGADVRAGLKAIIRKAAVERLSGILEQLRKDGKVDLHCSSTPACISLAIASTN